MYSQDIIQLCKNKGAVVMLTFPDILTNKMMTIQFYTGDLSSASYYISDADDIYVNGMSCGFIEI